MPVLLRHGVRDRHRPRGPAGRASVGPRDMNRILDPALALDHVHLDHVRLARDLARDLALLRAARAGEVGR